MLAGVGVVALATSSCAAQAEPGDASLVDRVRIAAGPWLADSTVRVQAQVEPGIVDPAQPAGSGTATLRERERSWRWDVSARLGERHGLRIGGFRVSADAAGSGSRVLLDDASEVQVDAAARGTLSLSVVGVAHTWWLRADEARAVGLGVGIARYRLATRVDGRLTVDDGPPGAGTARYAADALAPQLRLDLRQRLGPRWQVTGEVAWIRKPSGPFTGHAAEAAVGLGWQPGERFGAVFRYAVSEVDLRYRRPQGQAALTVRNHGPQVLLTWRLP
jgi:hypothetical protein